MILTITKDGKVNPVMELQIWKPDLEAIMGLLERRRKRKLKRYGKARTYELETIQ